jgi:hypothetical protein
MKITITVVAKPQGGARPRHIVGHYGFNRACLIEVINPNNSYCLFVAAELGRVRNEMLEYEADERKRKSKSIDVQAESKTKLTTRKMFRGIQNDANRQQTLAVELMRLCNIPMNLPVYNIEHLDTIQRYYNRIYDRRYQLSVFNSDPFTSKNIHPIWKGKCERVSGNEEIQNIYLFLEKEHFSVITCIASFFRVPKKKYCIGNFKLNLLLIIDLYVIF